jgi:hypothetical protein
LIQQLQTLIDEPAAPIEAVDEEMDDWDSFDAPPVASGSGSNGRKHTLFTDSLSASTLHSFPNQISKLTDSL